MADSSYLHWPFFEDRHRDHAERLEAWAGEHLGEDGFAPHDDVNADCKALAVKLAEGGWLRHAVPAPHGASDPLDVRTLCLTREILARHSGLADFVFAMQGLGSGVISLFGAGDQKARYLPDVAAGRKIAAFALTEPKSGSDVAATETSARVEGEEIILDGTKTYISNGGIADFYVVFARTGEAPGAKGLSAIIVDADAPGLEVAERIGTIAPHPLARLEFKDCRVPAANRVGESGGGFKLAMATLDLFRSTVGAAALGFARRAMDEAVSRAASRELFGGRLSDLQLVQAAIAEMALDADASALLIYRAAWLKDQGAARITREAAMAKLHATETAQTTIDKAVQLFGGAGVTTGSVVEALYREIRALRIYEGASEVQKVVIARQTLAEAGR